MELWVVVLLLVLLFGKLFFEICYDLIIRSTWMYSHKVFGWHYIEYRDSCTTFIARVKKTPMGDLRMVCGSTGSHYDSNLNKDGSFVSRSGSWTPLTWTQE